MAINLITQPGATVPYSGSDYIQQNLLINAALAQGDEVLTDWAESTAVPAIKQGVYFYHSGNSYQVQDSDSSISGTPVSGANYIGLAESGGVLTASYITDISSYTWNPAYNGLYNGSTLIIRAVTYLIGSAYHRALGADKAQSGMFILADGSFVSDGSATFGGGGSFGGNVALGGTIGPLLPIPPTLGSFAVANGTTPIIPAGLYCFDEGPDGAFSVGLRIEMWDGTTWSRIMQKLDPNGDYLISGGMLFSDGVNFRLKNLMGYTETIKYLKF